MTIITLSMTSDVLIIYRWHNRYKIMWPIRTFPQCSLWGCWMVFGRAIRVFSWQCEDATWKWVSVFPSFLINSYHFQVACVNDKSKIMHLRMVWRLGPNATISCLSPVLIFLTPDIQYPLPQSVSFQQSLYVSSPISLMLWLPMWLHTHVINHG